MDISELMQQARHFQEKMAQVQEELATRTVTGTAGGGMVTVTVNGKGDVLGMSIEPEVINPDDPQMLQDLIIAAVNDGLRKAKELGQGEMSKLTGGMRIPGLF
ncbi:YbaB/EbfC family nucleoid-associated protein [Desulfolithobacter sp.]